MNNSAKGEEHGYQGSKTLNFSHRFLFGNEARHE